MIADDGRPAERWRRQLLVLLPWVLLTAFVPFAGSVVLSAAAGYDDTCGPGFDHACFDGRSWLFRWGAAVAAVLSVVLWSMAAAIPIRRRGMRTWLMVLAVGPALAFLCGGWSATSGQGFVP